MVPFSAKSHILRNIHAFTQQTESKNEHNKNVQIPHFNPINYPWQSLPNLTKLDV